MTADERFDRLVSHYFDQALEEEGLRELSSLVAARPDYAKRFLRLGRIHGALLELRAPNTLTPVAPSKPKPPSHSLAKKVAWTLGAAFLVLLLLLLLILLRR